MKTILTGMFILSVFLIGSGCCARTNSAQTASNADALSDAAEVKFPANTRYPNYPLTDAATEVSQAQNTPPVEKPIAEDEADEEPNYTMRLLMDREYYEEEVETSIGKHKGWLGLYKKSDRYFLMPATLQVKAVRHDLRDEKDSDEKTGRAISSNVNLPSVFLLENASMLHAGEVKAVFYGDEENSEDINVRYRRAFDFNGVKYTLAVEDPDENTEWLTANSTLVLTLGKTRQTIYKQERCSDCSWDLCWVGDLDQDGRLDFLLNLSDHYNSTCHTLFLSSQAEKGALVKDVAADCTMGC